MNIIKSIPIDDMMLEIESAFEILPIKPNNNLKEIESIKNKIFFRYHPDQVSSEKPKELQKKLDKKYHEVFVLANSTYQNIRNKNMQYTQYEYDNYVDFFKQKLKFLNNSDLIIILEANDLTTTGNKKQLENRIIDNVPSTIANLNLEEHKLREQYVPNMKDILKEFPENKLIRILELKNINAIGDSMSLINKIVSSISEEEINNLINQVDCEINDLRVKLNRLKDKQLKLILDNNNLNSYGTKAQLITKIIQTFPISEIENNINKVSINKQKTLEKLYLITGKDELLDSFKQTLADNHLEIEDGIEIRKRLVLLINKYQIEEKDIELKLIEFINKKSQEIIDNTLEELCKITGKKSINSNFLKKLKDAGLDQKDGVQIKKEIIEDIKDWKVNKDNLKQYIDLKIKQKKLILQNEKIEILYNITGNTIINSFFKELLSYHYLDLEEGVEIKKKLINIIKTTNIDKKEIRPKLLELITLTASKKLINECDMSYLNQIAIINNLSKCNTKEEYVELFLESLSPQFNDLKIKSDITEINSIKEKLVKLYKNQLKFILISNNLSSDGIKNKLIDKIISNIAITGINLIISEINKINIKLNKLTINELNFILKENNIKATGTKTQIISEINKTLPFNKIKKDIKRLNEIISQLKELNTNELKFISKSNNLIIKYNKDQLIDEIRTQVPVNNLSENILEISNIKTLVKSFNKLQREHFLISEGLNDDGDVNTQVNKILENVDLSEINDFNNRIDQLKDKLTNLNVIQLDYILNKHNLEISTDTSIRINTILENILMPLIEKDIRSIKELENKINAVSEDEIDSILTENKLRKSVYKNENIDTIMKNLSFDEINEYLSGTKNNVNLIDEIKNSVLICPFKISNGKNILITENYQNSKFLLLFDDEKSFNEYKKDNESVKKLENDLNFFKKLINNNKKIEGIFVRNTPIKKNKLN